jgi:hypothetical protein
MIPCIILTVVPNTARSEGGMGAASQWLIRSQSRGFRATADQRWTCSQYISCMFSTSPMFCPFTTNLNTQLTLLGVFVSSPQIWYVATHHHPRVRQSLQLIEPSPSTTAPKATPPTNTGRSVRLEGDGGPEVGRFRITMPERMPIIACL